MRRRLEIAAAALAAAAAPLAAGCAEGHERASRSATVPAPAATEAPATPRLAQPDPPPPGTVRLEEGPFSDRVRAAGLRIERGRRPAVTGRLINVTDVSDVLLLELAAVFYAPGGRRVGSGRATFEETEPFADEPLRFRVRAARPAPAAAAAVLSIPQLVNE